MVLHTLKVYFMKQSERHNLLPIESNDDIILKTLVIANNNNSVQHSHAICQHKQLW